MVSNWVSIGLFGIFGIQYLGAGHGHRCHAWDKDEVIQQVTMKVVAREQIEEVKCRSCGGTLSAKDITLANGAPMVNCPYCHTIYQMTEEPKW
jgi:hypothetical protein